MGSNGYHIVLCSENVRTPHGDPRLPAQMQPVGLSEKDETWSLEYHTRFYKARGDTIKQTIPKRTLSPLVSKEKADHAEAESVIRLFFSCYCATSPGSSPWTASSAIEDG